MIGITVDLTVGAPYAYGRRGDAVIPTGDLDLFQEIGLVKDHGDLIGDDRFQVASFDRLFLVGHLQKALIDLFKLLCVQDVAQLYQPVAQASAAGTSREHDLRVGHANVPRVDDLVGGALLEHTVLVDAGRVGKGVRPNDRLVGLHRDARQLADQPADRIDPPGIDAGLKTQTGHAGS